MLSTAGRELPAAPVSHSAAAGSFDSEWGLLQNIVQPGGVCLASESVMHGYGL